MIRKLFLIWLLICCTHIGSAQVKYGIPDICRVSLDINGTDSALSLSVKMSAEFISIDSRPILLIKLFDDTVMELHGVLIQNNNEVTGAYIVGSEYSAFASVSDTKVSYAEFPISEDQVYLFATGIKQLRLTTSPRVHDKHWRKDRIGHRLYQRYLEKKNFSLNF